MINTQYKTGVLTNSTGPSMDEPSQVAAEHNILFEPINFDVVSLVDFSNCALLHTCLQYDVIYYRTLLKTH